MMSEVTAAKVQREAAEADSPALLCELEPWHRVFIRNLGDILLRREPPPVETTSRPAPLHRNYFIQTGIDPARFVESYSAHIVLVALVYAVCTLPFFNIAPEFKSPAHNTELAYVPISDYLPPINTATKAQMKPRRGAPKLAKQEILSVPPNPDNTRQTIVTPPKLKLDRDVPLPNIVAWTPIPAEQPVAASARAVSQLTVPQFQPEVVAPAPSVSQLKLKTPPQLQPDVVAPAADLSQLKAKLEAPALQPSVVAPPPSQDQLKLKAGNLNMAQLEPQVVAPKLPVPPQSASGGDTAAKGAGHAVAANVPPPANVQGVPSQGQGQLIALGLNPAEVRGPITTPSGNRSGEFHASPSGKADAPGTPNITSAGTADHGGGHGASNGAPAGIVVGAPPPGATTSAMSGTPNSAGTPGKNPAARNADLATRQRLIAEAMKPSLPSIRDRVAPTPPPPTSYDDDPDRSIEQRVFGNRRYYSLIMNMPNLASASGSWIIRFAELKQSDDKTPLVAPVALSKVDPAYPPDVLRDHIEGKVTLYAVIRADGTVANIRVLDSLDSRLDANAVRALSEWHFRPGTKNGEPVAVEAVVEIPFRMHGLR
jgi:TonB family protein